MAQIGLDIGVELLERHLDILTHGQRREQRPALEQHTPAVADADVFLGIGIDNRAAEHVNIALGRALQPDDRAHQHRFAGARSADHAENFAALDLEVQILVHDLFAEGIGQPFDDDRIVPAIAFVPAEFAARFVLRHQPHPTSVKNTAKKASMTITAKMPVTTAMVVRRPTSSEFPFTCMP